MKKNAFALWAIPFYVIVLFNSNHIIYSNNQDIPDTKMVHQNFDDNQYDFDLDNDLINPVIDDFLTKTEFCVSPSFNPSSILSTLIESFNALAIMQENLYLKTYPLNKRNTVDLPIFYDYYREYPQPRTFGINLFYNQTSRMGFCKDCDNISCYLAVNQQTLLDKIDDTFRCIREAFPSFVTDPLNILPLFNNITIQDRQAGIMFHGDKYYNDRKIHFHIHAPLMYQERNFYMTEEEQENVRETLGPSGSDDEKSTMEFAEKHLIADKFGIGDTRITLDWLIHKRPALELELGLRATIPTAFAFEKGLKGSSFENSKPPQCFNIGLIWDQFETEQCERGKEVVSDFMERALDRLSQMLLDTRLGNDRHLGLGATFTIHSRLSNYVNKSWARNVEFRTRVSLDYLFPAGETRFFIQKLNPDEFSDSNFPLKRIEDYREFAAERLQFLSDRVLEKLFPFRTVATVHPGAVFMWTSAWSYKTGRWTLGLITDFWAKTKESFGKIRYKPPVVLDIERGTRPYALQSKLGFNIMYTLPRRFQSWTFSLYGDGTYWAESIGKDFTLGFNIMVHF